MYGKDSVIPSQCFPTACGFRSPGLLSRHGTHERENGLRAIHRAGVPLARTICSAVPDARCRRNDVIEQGVPQLQLSVGHVTLRDELHEGAIPSMAELNDDIPERMAGRGPCDCGSPQKPGFVYAGASCSGTQDVSVARRAPSNPFCPVAWYPRKL